MCSTSYGCVFTDDNDDEDVEAFSACIKVPVPVQNVSVSSEGESLPGAGSNGLKWAGYAPSLFVRARILNVVLVGVS